MLPGTDISKRILKKIWKTFCSTKSLTNIIESWFPKKIGKKFGTSLYNFDFLKSVKLVPRDSNKSAISARLTPIQALLATSIHTYSIVFVTGMSSGLFQPIFSISCKKNIILKLFWRKTPLVGMFGILKLYQGLSRGFDDDHTISWQMLIIHHS